MINDLVFKRCRFIVVCSFQGRIEELEEELEAERAMRAKVQIQHRSLDRLLELKPAALQLCTHIIHSGWQMRYYYVKLKFRLVHFLSFL